MAGFIEQKQWQSFLDDFSKRNQFRATRLEVMNDLGAQEEESFLPLVGVSYEPKGSDAGDVVIILGGDEQRDLEHVIRRFNKSLRWPARAAKKESGSKTATAAKRCSASSSCRSSLITLKTQTPDTDNVDRLRPNLDHA